MKTTQIKRAGIMLTYFWRCAPIQTSAAPAAAIFATALARAQQKTLVQHIEQLHLS